MNSSVRCARRRFVTVVAALATTACGLPLGRVATPTPLPIARPARSEPVRSWLAAARAEGAVKVIADLSIREANELARLFRERYPGIELDIARRADPSADVILGDAVPTLASTRRWEPPEAKLIRSALRDPESRWHAVAATHWIFQTNTELVPPTARPTRYDQLAHSGWHGKLVLDSGAHTWLRGLFELHGRPTVVATLRPLARQAIHFRSGAEEVSARISAGQHAAAIANTLDAVERDKRLGAKTTWNALGTVIVQPFAVAVLDRAAHPNAASIFANFLLGGDAQLLLARHGRVPARADIDPEPQELLAGVATHVTRPVTGQEAAELRATWDELWRPG
jgi:iron(III) transport system substrate-binding protein